MNVVIRGNPAELMAEMIVIPVSIDGFVNGQGVSDVFSKYYNVRAEYITHLQDGSRPGEVVFSNVNDRVFALAFVLHVNSVMQDAINISADQIKNMVLSSGIKSIVVYCYGYQWLSSFSSLLDALKNELSECYIDVLVS